MHDKKIWMDGLFIQTKYNRKIKKSQNFRSVIYILALFITKKKKTKLAKHIF